MPSGARRTRVPASIVIWTIAAACLVPTVLLWRRSVDNVDRVERERLVQLATNAEDLLGVQLARLVDLLRAVDGQISSSVLVTQAEFALFVDRLQLEASFQGAEAVFVFSRTERDTVVSYAAPQEQVREHVGMQVDQRGDLSTLLGAIDRAASTGVSAATPLMTEPDASGGHEFFVVSATPDVDRFVGVRVDLQPLIEAFAAQLRGVTVTVADEPDVAVSVTPTPAPTPTVSASGRTATVEVTGLGRLWQVTIESDHDVLDAGERREPWAILGACLLASLAMIGFAVHQTQARRKAVTLADRAARSELTHRRLLDAAPVAIVELNPGGVVQSWNAAAAALFGIPSADAVGERLVWPAHDGAYALDRPDLIDALHGTLATLDTVGGRRHVAALTTTLAEAGLHRLLLLVDETGQQLLAAQLVEAHKLEIFGRLAGGIAHDFNNFLTAVMGYIDIVLMRDRIDASDRSALVESRRASERAAAVVAQLLTISRRQVTKPEVIDVAALVEGLAGLLRTVAGSRAQVRLHIADDDMPASVRIDRTHLEQIILNLVVNAGEAMIDAGRIDVWLEQRNDSIVLRVVDDGPGLDPSVAPHVFEPFFTTKGGHGGTGLGLSTVFSIVTSAEGTITVASTPGRGATFEIVFPRAAADHAVDEAPSRTVERRPTDATIMLVEDDPSVRRLTTAVLQQHGYHVISAGDAEEATSLFLEHRADIDLLVSDVVLPGRSGPQLAAELLRQRPALPVLFMSGYAEGALSEHGRLPAGTRFVGKPFRADDLIRQVEDALGAAG